VKLDKKAGVGNLDCKICGQNFQCGINCEYLSFCRMRDDCVVGGQEGADKQTWTDLSAAVDVYSEWVDAAGKFGRLELSQWYASLTIVDAVAQGRNGGDMDEDTLREPSRARISSGRPAASKGRADAYEEDDDGGYEGEGIVADDEEYE